MELVVRTDNAGRRLDRFLFAYMNSASHSFVYKMLRKKRIKLNDKRAGGGEILAVGDRLRFYISSDTIGGFRKEVHVDEAKPMPEIIYEDSDVLVVNKPAGLVSMGGMEGKIDHLLARLLFYLQKKGDYPPDADFTPGICNRLDVNTSGLVVCGKNLKTLQKFNALFKDRKIAKEYAAIVDGTAGAVGETRILRGFIEKDKKARIAKISQLKSGSSQEAITKFTVLASGRAHSLLSVEPVTGRFHQIRAHLSSIGHPLHGDKKYGSKGGQWPLLLHCRCLTVDGGDSWEAPMPKIFEERVSELFGVEGNDK